MLGVTGMTCNHCRESVRRALAECEGAESVDVSLADGMATVTGPADPAALHEAVESLGFGAELTAAGQPGSVLGTGNAEGTEQTRV